MPNSIYKTLDTEAISNSLQDYQTANTYVFFNHYIEVFLAADAQRFNSLVSEAHDFIFKEATKFPEEQLVVSFSGGKDSTVTADLAINALSNPNLIHIFGDTTLELPSTIEYSQRYRGYFSNCKKI